MEIPLGVAQLALDELSSRNLRRELVGTDFQLLLQALDVTVALLYFPLVRLCEGVDAAHHFADLSVTSVLHPVNMATPSRVVVIERFHHRRPVSSDACLFASFRSRTIWVVCAGSAHVGAVARTFVPQRLTAEGPGVKEIRESSEGVVVDHHHLCVSLWWVRRCLWHQRRFVGGRHIGLPRGGDQRGREGCGSPPTVGRQLPLKPRWGWVWWELDGGLAAVPRYLSLLFVMLLLWQLLHARVCGCGCA